MFSYKFPNLTAGMCFNWKRHSCPLSMLSSIPDLIQMFKMPHQDCHTHSSNISLTTSVYHCWTTKTEEFRGQTWKLRGNHGSLRNIPHAESFLTQLTNTSLFLSYIQFDGALDDPPNISTQCVLIILWKCCWTHQGFWAWVHVRRLRTVTWAVVAVFHCWWTAVV